MKGWKKLAFANGNQKKGSTGYTYVRQSNFQSQTVCRDEEGHRIMIQGSFQQEDRTVLNLFTPNTWMYISRYMGKENMVCIYNTILSSLKKIR